MTKRHDLYVIAKCFGLLFLLSDALSAVLTMPTVDDGEMEASSQVIGDKIDMFKRDILSRLGYTRPPDVSNVTINIEEKRRMIQQYRKYIEERDQLHKIPGDEDDNEEDKIQSKTFFSLEYTGEVPSNVQMKDWNVKDAFRIFFNSKLSHPADDHTKELLINSAKLRIYISKVRPENLKDTFSVDKQIRINVYQILSANSVASYKRTLLDSKLVSLDETSWQSFEIQKAVQSWVNNKDSNLGLEIAVDSQDIHDVVDIEIPNRVANISGTALTFNSTTNSPSVHIYAQEKYILKRVKRRNRRRKDCKRGDGETKCCRYPIRISFSEIGWDDWIIAPLEYKGYYCSGTCPYRHKMANTFVGIKALLHLKNPDKVPSPCCVATKLKPFTVLHYAYDGRYTFSDYPDFVVEQCKCG